MNRIIAGLVVLGLLATSVRAHADETGRTGGQPARPLVASYAQELRGRSHGAASDTRNEQAKTGGGKSLALVWTVVGTAASLAATAYYVKTMQKTAEGAPKAR